jgi:hypothetical protein
MEATFQQVYNERHDGTLPKAIEYLYVEPQNARGQTQYRLIQPGV